MSDRFLYPQGTLPPPDARLINPYSSNFEPIKTPVDDRGIIDIDRLIDDVKATVDPSYDWPLEANVHHFYWPEANYIDTIRPKDPLDSLRVFRELSIHRGYVPRVFENWLHLVTAPPEIPDREVRHYRVEAWLVARDLFRMARKTIACEKNIDKRYRQIKRNPHILKPEFGGVDVIGEEILLEAWDKNFRGYEQQRARHNHIPPEFHLIDLDSSPAEVAKELGRMVVPRSLRLVNRWAA